MSKLSVLVSGASIAGPTAAYWLAKAGARVTVVERFPTFRPGGQNIDIRTTGVSVMRRTPGMEKIVRAERTQLDGLSFVRDDGRPYGVLRATGNPDQQSLISEYEIDRGKLGRILYNQTKDNRNINYIFGEQISSIQPTKKNLMTVNFANGTPATTFDLVVACDGATSRTRPIGLECATRAYIHPTNCWAAYFTIRKDLLQGSKIGLAHCAPGGRFVSLASDPSAESRATLFGLNVRNRPEAAEAFRRAQKQGDDATKRYVAQHFRSVGWKTQEVLEGMMEAEDFYASEIVQVKVPKLYKDRFVLVGDAGYAPGFTGTGTTLAMTGAYILAGEVGKHRNDLGAALEGYERQLRPLINEMQKVPPFVPGFMAPQTKWGLSIRNGIFTFVTRTRALEYVQKYLGSAFASNNEAKLPEYEWTN